MGTLKYTHVDKQIHVYMNHNRAVTATGSIGAPGHCFLLTLITVCKANITLFISIHEALFDTFIQ